jgi:hypothetical protein|tara:strand:+ start:493 stop:1071 length:579 start_codon:yes stop_codon:yes gene_type:complete
MTSIVLVDKTGSLKQTKVKDLTRDKLHTKCGFKKNDNFDSRTTWTINIAETKYTVELWSKDDGKANSENKYDFPPPVDTELYFGTCCLIRLDDDGEIISLTVDEWVKIYEALFGGFEDVYTDEEASDDELDNVPAEMKTKQGYLKDGFVVNTDSDENKESTDGDYEEDSGEESEDDSDDELEEEPYDYSDEE